MKRLFLFSALAAAVTLALIIPGRVAAQATITVAAGSTYQTWRGFSMGETAQSLIYAGSAGTGCTNPITITAAQRDQIYQYRVQDLGEVGERLNIYHNDQTTTTGWLEWTRNDDTNPFNIVQSAFDSNFNIPPRISNFNGCNYYLTDELSDVRTWRNDVIANGETPWVEVTFFFYRDLANQPTWWQTGSPNSTGCGVDEASEAFHATLNYIHTNYGFYPDWATWNEPNPSTGYFTAESTSYTGPGCMKPADWYGGWVKSLHDRLASAGIPTKVTGPNPAGLTDTLRDLNAIALVSGAEPDLGACTFHLYGTWTTTDLDNISNRCRGSDGIETREDESAGDNSASALANGTDYISGRTGNFYAALTHGNVSSYLLYSDATANLCASSCNSSDSSVGGITVTSNGSQIVLLPKFWALRQFGRYVRPGYVRISAVSSDGNVVTTAWKRPDGTQVVVIVNNNASTNNVTINGLDNNAYVVHKLDASMCGTAGQNRCAPDDSTSLTPSSGSLVLSMVSGAIWTLAEGSEADFALSATPASATVAAGQTTSYTLNLVRTNGFNQTVSIGCLGPSTVTCSVTPSSVISNGSSQSTATITATTTVRSTVGRRSVPNADPSDDVKRILPRLFWFLFALASAITVVSGRRKGNVRLAGLFLGAILLLLTLGIGAVGCSGSSTASGTAGTAPGAYTLTLQGTAGTLTRSATVTLNVN